MDSRIIANQNKAAYFPALTGVRAIAAYMVYAHHFNPAEDFSKKLGYFFDEFHIGVTFFFVLSGFLISYRYYDNPTNFRQYIVNRFARIYPMYFLVTTLYFVFHHINIESVITYLLNITFLRGFFSQYIFSMVAQGWSLTVEETFYFLAPLFLYLVLKSKSYLIKLPIIILAFGVLQVLVFSHLNFYGFMDSFELLFNLTFWGRCIEFFLGMYLAVQFKGNKNVFGTYKYKTFTGILIVLVCIISLALIRQGYHLEFGIKHPFGMIINNILLPAFGIIMIYEGLLTENNIITRILASRLFVLLGKSSYLFYLIHLGIIQVFIYKAVSYYELYTPLEYSIVFVALNIIAILMYLLLEEPMNKFLRKKLSAKRNSTGELPINQSAPVADQP